MRQMMKICVSVAICLMAMACENSQVEQWLIRAEGCMETHSDSAFRCLQYVEGASECSDGQRARYALLRTQAMHKCRIPLENDSLINVAVAYYAESDDRHRLALSLLYKGLVHKQNHQAEQAVEAFVASEQAFEEVDDNQYKALLFNHYAALLMNQDLYEDALEYYRRAYQYELKGDSVHYVVSTCGQIARMYDMLDMKDSARAYYERGLLYKDDLCDGKERIFYLLLQNYAAFLIEGEDYPEAEKLLHECLENMKDSNYLPTLYSALTTLYYEKKELDKALYYGQQILASDDSLTVCGGYLRLYNIYKGMGQMDSAFYYHDLFRQYDSDITLRRQTAKVAAIPNKMKSLQLAEENQVLTDWRAWLVVSLAIVAMVATTIYIRIRKRHSLEQRAKERELTKSQTSLADTQTSLSDTKNQLAETKVNLGRMKGTLAHQAHAFDRMKRSLEELKRKHQEEIRRLKENVKTLEEDIQEQKSNDRSRNQTESELKQSIKMLGKQLKAHADKLQHVEHQREIDRRIEYFMASGMDAVAVELLLQLRLNKIGAFRYDIRATEHLPLLKVLLEQENPALHQKLDDSGLDSKKLIMCYLMALGFDDVEMMARAACVSINSVKAYRKECQAILEMFGE